MTNAFIPAELAVAPNSLGVTANLKLTAIPLDSATCFELWLPSTETILFYEEAMLLVQDRPRLEEICARLTWLLGANPQESDLVFHLALMYDWQVVETYLQQVGVKIDAIGVTYLPQTIQPHDRQDGISIAWNLRPTSWQISFFKLHPVAKGYQVEVQPVSLLISTGPIITKLVQGVAVSTRHF